MGYLTNDLELTDLAVTTLDTVEGVFRKTKIKGSEDILGPDYLKHIEIYRSKFPSGKKATPEEVKNKFIKLLEIDPSVTWNEIHAATDLYFSEPPDDVKYIMKAGNFIMVKRGDSNTYTLLELIERVREGQTASDNTSDINIYPQIL